VHITKSMSPTDTPAAFSARIKVSSLYMFHFGRSGRGLSLPIQLSIRMV
jgi:hypothetical protein